MSQGGSIKHRLEKKHEELALHEQEWRALGLPGPQPMYRMNNDEFAHHVHLLALERVLKEKLGVTDDEIELAVATTFLEEAKVHLGAVKEFRSKQVREGLVDGIIGPDGKGIKI